jgi:hypothetical protein
MSATHLEKAIENLSETARQYAHGTATLEALKLAARDYTEAAIDDVIRQENGNDWAT